MNYQAYFNNAQHNGISFVIAYQMLATFMNITSDLEDALFYQNECVPFEY